MRPCPEPRVLNWLAEQPIEQLYMAAITEAEIRRGLALLPEGTRRDNLEDAFTRFLEEGFSGRILSFSESTAAVYAPIYARRVKAGLRIDELGLLLAAIATEHRAAISTRNTSDFEESGVKLINPWEI